MPATTPTPPVQPPANTPGRWAPTALPTPPRRATGCACWSSRPGGGRLLQALQHRTAGLGHGISGRQQLPARRGSGAPPPPPAPPTTRSTSATPARLVERVHRLPGRFVAHAHRPRCARDGAQRANLAQDADAAVRKVVPQGTGQRMGRRRACGKCRQPTHSRGIRPTGWLALLYFAIPFMNSALRPTLCASLPSATLGPLPSALLLSGLTCAHADQVQVAVAANHRPHAEYRSPRLRRDTGHKAMLSRLGLQASSMRRSPTACRFRCSCQQTTPPPPGSTGKAAPWPDRASPTR